MKAHFTLMAALIPLAASAQQGKEAPSKRPFRNALTHEDLAKRLRVSEAQDPMKKLSPSTGGDPVTSGPKSDFLKESDIICFNGVATFVPKQAILAAPENLKDRLGIKKGARIVSWVEFLRLNRGWVTTVEVSRIQAEGVEPLPEETTKQVSKSKNLIVATYRGGPISVLPPKVTEEGDTKTTKTP